MKERDPFEEQEMDGRIIIKWMSNKWDATV
jgi:hypothetical protein